MKNKREFMLAIDAGGTCFKSSIIDSSGSVVEGTLTKMPVDSKSKNEGIFCAYEKIIKNAYEVSRKQDFEISGIGISTPGPFDYDGYTSLMTHKFQCIYGVNLKELFISSCGIPSSLPVKFLHDVHAFVLGEHWNGNAKGYKRVVATTIGTGIGFGAIIDNKILHNGQGGPYVSIYRKPCKDGILEDYVSGRGIIREYCRMAGLSENDEIDAREIGRRADADRDCIAIETYNQVGRLLGESIKETLVELDVECLILGGQISRSFNIIEEGLKSVLYDVNSLKKITCARNIDKSPLVGAARCVFEAQGLWR